VKFWISRWKTRLLTSCSYLRRAQFRALETYWYLRLVLNTPRIPDLYATLFPKPKDRREAMGLTSREIVDMIADDGLDAVLELLQTDNGFVRKHGLESLRETFSLDYPSYILALAMGAGKTILMGSIVATEFAMALEYPRRPVCTKRLGLCPRQNHPQRLCGNWPTSRLSAYCPHGCTSRSRPA
jgi:type III restriction enzyme